MNSAALADFLLDRGKVAVVPGSTFGDRGEGYLRLSYAVSMADCKAGMERIAQVMRELMRGR